MKEVNKICDDKDIQWLVVAGDTFHDFNVGGKYASFGSVFDSINGPFNDFLAVDDKRKILIIPGNHDMPTEKGSKDALTSWEYNPRIYISREPEAFKLADALHIITLPWMWSHQYKKRSHILKRIQELKFQCGTGRVMLVGHCEIEGTPFPSGYTMFGGNFAFTKDEIDELKFSIVALGHIHQQDNWYVGAPWQHNFGECNLLGTMRIVETNGPKGHLTNKVIAIPNTARYHVIDMDKMPHSVPKGDYVKVVGEKLTVALPPGYKFEKKKENYKAVARSTSDYGDSISAWLQKWVAEKNVTTSIADCLEIIKDINIKGRYIHNRSLASFESIKIKGIGPHKDTSLSFTDPIIAISGENGTGKTIFMESMFALLYGYLPSYGKVNHISDNDASIEGEFSTATDRYRVLRTYHGEEKKAWVWKNGEKTAHIGPKISEVKKFLEKIVGPEELLLSSVFSTQHYLGDIVDLDPGKRKDIFNKLLGLENLEEVKEVVDEKLKALVTKNNTLTSQYGVLPTVEELETTIVHNMKELTDNREKISRGHIDKDQIRNRNDVLAGKITAFGKEMLIKANLEKENIETQKKISDLNMCIASKQGEITTRKQWTGVEDVQAKLDGNEIILTSFDALFLRQKKDYETQAQLTKICTEKQEEYNRANQNIKATKFNYSVQKDNIEEAKELLKETGCIKTPLPCKFIDSSMEDVKSETEVLKKYKDYMKREGIKLTNLEEDLKVANKRKKNFKITEVDEAAHENIKIEIVKLRKQIVEINDNQNQINIAHTELKSLQASKKEYEKNHVDIYRKIALMFEVTDEKLSLLNTENSVQYEQIEAIDKLISAYTIKSTEHRKELEFSRNEILKIQEYDKEIGGLATKIEKYEVVSKAFSKDGIPQLMIDCALPQLQDILNQLTSYIRKFDIKISTQQEQKNETLKETISFIVDDGIKSRDIKYFSGGEKKLLKSIVRLGLSLFQSQRSGSSYRLLFMDEAFDALDRDNSILLLRIIYNLRLKFNQIFIISHSTDILGNLSKCIRFEIDGERTVIK
jgi:DNA repair exonuclease SbcCD ATPase subunit